MTDSVKELFAEIDRLNVNLAFCREAMRHADIDLSMVLPFVSSDMQKSIRKTLDRIDEARERSNAITSGGESAVDYSGTQTENCPWCLEHFHEGDSCRTIEQRDTCYWWPKDPLTGYIIDVGGSPDV